MPAACVSDWEKLTTIAAPSVPRLPVVAVLGGDWLPVSCCRWPPCLVLCRMCCMGVGGRGCEAVIVCAAHRLEVWPLLPVPVPGSYRVRCSIVG